MDNNLAAPCGIYCGACRQYLVLKKDQLKKRGFKIGCKGCRTRNKNCTFIRRDCSKLRKTMIEFCYECDEFPCQNLVKMDSLYQKKYHVNMIENLKRIQVINIKNWLKEQEALYRCPKCEGEICVHDAECYDCGIKINPNMKEY